MVDSISSKPVQGVDRQVVPVSRVAQSAPVEKAASARDDVVAEQLKLSAVAFGFNEQSAPIDQDRVARIRAAIRNGTFPIYPAKIADTLIALKLEWNPNAGK